MTAITAMVSPIDYSPSRGLQAKLRRRYTQWHCCAPLGAVDSSMITFSFDDFPRSAADTGADILASINAPAIYYACSGLANAVTITGEQYEPGDMLDLSKAGHEIGAHTHTHLDCAEATLETVLADINNNLNQLKAMGLEQSVTHFAYPYGETTIALKRSLMDKFQTCRGINAGLNGADADRTQLVSMELTPDSMTTDRAIQAIEAAQRKPIWLNIFTHDVSASPSVYGTSPESLKKIARAARDSGLPIVTPSQAMERLAKVRHA